MRNTIAGALPCAWMPTAALAHPGTGAPAAVAGARSDAAAVRVGTPVAAARLRFAGPLAGSHPLTPG